MKVLDVYSKKDLDTLTIRGRSVSKIMDDFFKNFPATYRDNYDKNIANVEIWKVDEHYDGAVGEYFERRNILLYKKKLALPHEFMHLASTDLVTKINAFSKTKNTLFEDALIEGFTEYFSSWALNMEPTDYYFEVFSTAMLSNIDGIFEPYFIPSYDNFVNMFPNKKDILSLMYALSFYTNNSDLIEDDDLNDERYGKAKDTIVSKLQSSVQDVIDSLINIQISMNMGRREDMEYSEKFLELLKQRDVSSCLGEIWNVYFDYAQGQIKRRILRRK